MLEVEDEGLVFNLLLVAFLGCRNRFWVFLHQISSNSEQTSLQKFVPVDVVHVKVEDFFVSGVEFAPKVLWAGREGNLAFVCLKAF
jgi:signal peptidase I